MTRALIAALALLALSGCGEASSGASSAGGTATEQTKFGQVFSACDLAFTAAELGDDGYTLIIDGRGAEDVGGLPIEDLVCALNHLDTPDSVITLMASTTALQGRQSGTWDDIEASWTYHPDNGLDIVLTLGES